MSSILEKKLGVKQFSMDERDDENLEMDFETGEPPNDTKNTDPFDEDLPSLTGASDFIAAKTDVWTALSGVAILALTPDKTAALLQFKEAIENRFGDACVERQETWTTFVMGPIPKKLRSLDGIQDPFDGFQHEELASIHDVVPIRHVSWTRRSLNDESVGNTRLCVPEIKASKFSSRLRLFGEAVSIQGIRKRNQI
ncbi:hypothetical protein EPUL_004565 [Erysiphe pulchra]|uniref:Uncharacterized protein n=1 Tax=Erysiphe pulchra TaxID=225359 RepID=A0A2S4PPE3_9PEZI|nr:hypothetical protein EPUL_004565 [Erysiphe pulchra]